MLLEKAALSERALVEWIANYAPTSEVPESNI